jgi:fluoride exporter
MGQDAVVSMRHRLLVLAGGALGTALRLGAFEWFPHRRGTFPTTTLVVNCVGAVLLGSVAAWTLDRDPSGDRQAFVRVGVLGGFTTFSAYTVELAEYLRDDRWAIAAIYAVAMTTLTLVAAACGQAIVDVTRHRLA